MRKYLILTTIVFSFVFTNAQGIDPADSVRIASLKKQLKNAKGIKEVDILNDIAWEYNWGSKDKTPILNYATQAKNKAESIGYEKGVAYASLVLGWYYRKSDKSLYDSLSKKALSIAEKQKDARLLGWCYYDKWDLKKANAYFRQAKDLDGEAETCTWLCAEYTGRTDMENDFSYCQRAVELATIKKNNRLSYNKWVSGYTYTTMADLYNYVGDYQSALAMVKMSEKYATPRDLYWSYASTYKEMSKFDSSLYYYEKALENDSGNIWHVMRYVGYANQKVGNYSRAIQLLEEASKLFLKAESKTKSVRFKWWRGEIHSHLAEAYDSAGKRKEAIKNYEFALEHSRKYFQELQKPWDDVYDADRINWIMKTSNQLSKIFQGLRQYDSAYFYLTRYTQMKDTVDSKKRIRQLNMELTKYKRMAEDQKRTSQLQLLQKDNELKKAKLKQETFMKNGLAIGLILLLLFSVFTFRTLQFKRKNEKLRRMQLENELTVKELESKQKQTELQHKATELEMQALRAQMNPHFIFNCLSSINKFILKNEPDAASDYLTRFSRLIRMVLINSQKPLITLEDELDMLTIYLDMERLRFKNTFDYQIAFTNRVDAGALYIPSLLLQPFCENAIWHGIRHLPDRQADLADPQSGQQEPGRLDIVLSMDNKVLNCSITDNGIGRQKAAEIKSKSAEDKKSLGLKITTERLALLNKENNFSTFYKIEDVLNDQNEVAGTRVELKISYKESVEELV